MLRRLVALLVLAAAVGAQAGAAPASAADMVRNPGDPYYEARLRAGQGGRVWTGRINISFTNLEAAPLSTIYLRLWSNGVDGCAAGAIEIWDLTGGSLGTPALDCTEVPVTLDRALAPGERATLSMRLRITLPRRSDRFGYSGGLALVGTALPTLEVHDDRAGTTTPSRISGNPSTRSPAATGSLWWAAPDLDTPATGTLVASKPLPNGLVARTYTAADVRDFAWAAGRLEQVSGNAGPTKVVVSYRAGAVTETQAQSMLAAAQKSVSTFSASFGPYPYPELDVVLGAFPDFGGMEYPTIVFSEVDKWTVAHEIAHQWWYGLVGNNQYAEPWLDESLATWSEELPWGAWVGCGFVRLPRRRPAHRRHGLLGGSPHPVRRRSTTAVAACWPIWPGASGGARFIAILRDYAADHWLGVARTGDFTAAIEAAAVLYGVPFNPAVYWATWRVDTP